MKNIRKPFSKKLCPFLPTELYSKIIMMSRPSYNYIPFLKNKIIVGTEEHYIIKHLSILLDIYKCMIYDDMKNDINNDISFSEFVFINEL